jgi:hypothetical protein
VNDRKPAVTQSRRRWVVGGSIALANFAFKRPSVPIPENIRYNESLRAQLETQNRAIAAQKQHRWDRTASHPRDPRP